MTASARSTNTGISVQIKGALKPCDRGPGTFSENARRIVWLDKDRTIVRIEFKNDNFYEGSLDQDNKAGGFGILVCKTDRAFFAFIGIFVKGQFTNGTELRESGEMYSGPYKDSWRHGTGILRKDGAIYRVIYTGGAIQQKTRLELNEEPAPVETPTKTRHLISYEKEVFVVSKSGNSLRSKSGVVKRLFSPGKYVKKNDRYQITSAQVTESTGRFFYGTLHPSTRKAEGFGVLITPHTYRAGVFREGRLSRYGIEVSKSTRYAYLGLLAEGVSHGSALWIEGGKGYFFGPWKDDKPVGALSFFPRLEDIPSRQPANEVAQAVAQAAAQLQQAQAQLKTPAPTQNQKNPTLKELARRWQEALQKQGVPKEASEIHWDDNENVFIGKFNKNSPEGEGLLYLNLRCMSGVLLGKWIEGKFFDEDGVQYASWNQEEKRYEVNFILSIPFLNPEHI